MYGINTYMNNLVLFLWNRFPVVQEEWFLHKMKLVVIGLWICTALAGMFFTYRLGQYIEVRRHIVYIQTN